MNLPPNTGIFDLFESPLALLFDGASVDCSLPFLANIANNAFGDELEEGDWLASPNALGAGDWLTTAPPNTLLAGDWLAAAPNKFLAGDWLAAAPPNKFVADDWPAAALPNRFVAGDWLAAVPPNRFVAGDWLTAGLPNRFVAGDWLAAALPNRLFAGDWPAGVPPKTGLLSNRDGVPFLGLAGLHIAGLPNKLELIVVVAELIGVFVAVETGLDGVLQ